MSLLVLGLIESWEKAKETWLPTNDRDGTVIHAGDNLVNGLRIQRVQAETAEAQVVELRAILGEAVHRYENLVESKRATEDKLAVAEKMLRLYEQATTATKI